MTIPIMVRKPSAFLPVAMSLTALAVIFIYIALHGTSPQADEGTAAHLWQLLMGLQIPLIAYFAIRWLPQSPKHALAVLVLQILAAIAALAPVYLLHW
jgi:peptidoglycan/LPS O-acetylase OafA/YrhL